MDTKIKKMTVFQKQLEVESGELPQLRTKRVELTDELGRLKLQSVALDTV